SSVGRSNLMSWHAPGALHRAEGCSVDEAERRIAAEVGLSPTYVRAHPLTSEEKERLGSVLRRILREYPKAFAIDSAYQTAKMVAAPDKLVLKPLGIQPGGLPTRGRSDAGQMGDT